MAHLKKTKANYNQSPSTLGILCKVGLNLVFGLVMICCGRKTT